MSSRKVNILVRGTPGTGKSSTCALLAQQTRLKHIDIEKVVKDHELHTGWIAELYTYRIKEDELVKHLEEQMSAGGNIVDASSCNFFPTRWFDLVVVLQADHDLVFERLTNRGGNLHYVRTHSAHEHDEIHLADAYLSYRDEIVMPLSSDSIEDMSHNVGLLKEWVRSHDPSLVL